MGTRQGRMRSFVEWTVATALLVGLFAVGLNLLGQLRRVVPITPVIALEPEAPAPPSVIPPRAVSVPMLPLAGNVRIQVGEFAADVLSRIQGLVDVRADAVERRTTGERTTREFRHAGGSFFLVMESAAAGAAPRVTGIFIP